MSGYETCERIREDHGPHLPVIMMTAFGDPAAVRRGYEAGADDFLHKPVDTPSLILKVRAFLRLKSLHDELAKSREEAQARARDLARLQEIGRDWSLIAEPEEFSRMVTSRLAGLIGAPIVGIALHDPVTRTMEAALPVHGLDDAAARRFRYVARPEYRSLWSPRTGRPYVSNQPRRPAARPGDRPPGRREVGRARPHVLRGRARGPAGSGGQAGRVHGRRRAAPEHGRGPGGHLRAQPADLRPRAPARLAARAPGRPRGRHGRRVRPRAAPRAHRPAHAEGPGLRARGLPRARARGTSSCWRRRRERVSAKPPRTRRRCAGRSGSPPRSRPRARRRSRSSRCPCVPATTRWASSSCASAASAAFDGEETHMLSTLAGPLALALRRAESEAATEHMARQMATLYDLGLETSALRDLQSLFLKATEEAGRLIQADHTSVFRMEEAEGVLRLFAIWSREPEPLPEPEADVQGRGGDRRPRGPRLHPRPHQRRGEARELRAARQPRVADPLRAPHALRPRAQRARRLRRAERDPRPGLARVHERRPRVPDPLRRPALDRGRQLGGLRRGAPEQRSARARQRPPSRDRGQPAARAHPGDGGAAHPRGLPLSRGLDPDPGAGVRPLPRGRGAAAATRGRRAGRSSPSPRASSRASSRRSGRSW